MQKSLRNNGDVDIQIRTNGNGHLHTDVDIHSLLETERKRLEHEIGLQPEVNVNHATRPMEGIFTKDQRETTTILFGGLTWKHEALILSIFKGLGYSAEYLNTPSRSAFQIGKEYGNNGQCNPTYFTVGNLIQHLMKLEETGLSREAIIDKYVFFTAGACGPCRFGMYEAEYRLALRNAGFEGFRVLILQQTGGLNQSEVEAGLEMNLDFTLGILNALNIGDILNDIAYQIRPFEIEPGATDAALEASIAIMADALKEKKNFELNDTSAIIEKLSSLKDPVEKLVKFGRQVFGDGIISAMKRCRTRFEQVQVDRTRVRPIVKITGEFWAQTTEGDGNFNMFRFLEREGAQVVVEPIATWLLYMLHQVKQELTDRKYLELNAKERTAVLSLAKMKSWSTYKRKFATFTLAEYLFKREYNRLRAAMGNLPHPLTDQYEMQRMGHPYYNSRVEGGEGHLEVAKNIYYSTKDLSHMVLSVKPFGCMPSTQSDGVQSAVTSHFKDIIYLPIETSGEGEINAHSRVQMALGEARIKAKEEFRAVLEERGIDLSSIQKAIQSDAALRNPFYHFGHRKGVVGVAANFLLHAFPTNLASEVIA